VLACELVRRDVPIRIIDKLTEPTNESRAIVIHARSLEMFSRVGMVDELIDSGVKTTTFEMYDDGERIARIALDTIDSPFPFSVTTAQTETERVLTERLKALGVEIERGIELVSLEQDGARVHSTLLHSDRTEEQVSSSFIAGTDGARSTVREQFGTRLEGSFKGERFLMGDVDADSALEHGSMATYFVEHGGPLMAFPMVGKRMRLIAQLTADAAGEQGAAPTIEQLQENCDRCAPAAEIKIASSRWLTYFEIHHAQVPSYRFGRGFLAGDAAHVHSPAGAQGMNTGMQDAFNLGWKLGTAARGDNTEALLNSYHSERHPVAARVISLSTKATTLATLESPLTRRLRRHALHLGTGLAPIEHKLARQTEEADISYRDSPIVSGTHHGGPRPGDAAPAVAGTGLFAELTAATDHAIVSVAASGTAPAIPARPPADARVIAVADLPGEVPGIDAALSDPERRIAERYGFGETGGWVVVRPDGYIGLITGAGEDAALSRYFGAIRATVRSANAGVPPTSNRR
jgi:2-polyprenyl-6-methoxyphenol hydroxylase-like FAD-dependent oxidoreductase